MPQRARKKMQNNVEITIKTEQSRQRKPLKGNA